MTALFIVRAQVPEVDRTAFDHWYETEHLPDAMAAFGVTKARRGWSDLEASTHVAVYEFESIAQAREIVGGDASAVIKALIEEFDRVWQGRVTRTRELVGVQQTLTR